MQLTDHTRHQHDLDVPDIDRRFMYIVLNSERQERVLDAVVVLPAR